MSVIRCPIDACGKIVKSKGGLAAHFLKSHHINLKGRKVDSVVALIERNQGVYPFANMPEYIPSERMEERVGESALYPQDDSPQNEEFRAEIAELRNLIEDLSQQHRHEAVVIEPRVQQEEAQRDNDTLEEERLRHQLGLDELKNEIEDIKRRYLQPHVTSTHRDVKYIDELQNRRVEEKISENLTLPLSPPPLPPPFMESLTDKIKRLNERALFR